MPFSTHTIQHAQAIQTMYSVLAPSTEYRDSKPKLYDSYSEAVAHAKYLAIKFPGVEFKIGEIYRIEIGASVVFGE